MKNTLYEIITFVTPYTIPLILIAAGMPVSIILDRLISRYLKKLAMLTKWQGDDIIVASMKGKIKYWFMFGITYVALYISPMTGSNLAIGFKAITVLFIISMTFTGSKVAVGFLDLYNRASSHAMPAISIVTNLTRVFVFLIGLLVVMQYLGISIAPVLTALGVGGLAVALALQDTLSNLFSGIYIIITRQTKIGDYIRLEADIEGYVTDITWRNTTVKALKNNLVVIPNSKLASSIVTNFSQPQQEMTIWLEVGVSYKSDLEHVEQVTIEVAKELVAEHPGASKEYEPLMRYYAFDDFSINFRLVLRVIEFAEQYKITHELIKRLHKRYNEEGIVIPFPIRTVQMEK